MPKFNLDEDETLSEPIEIVIDGKTFTVSKLTNKKFKKVGELDDIGEQFALLTGAKLSIVNGLNLIKVTKAIQHIIQNIMGSMRMSPNQLLTREELESKETESKNV